MARGNATDGARRGGGAGPDFRDAVLARSDGAYLYGDIELHLRPAGWQAHGHASDPRYNGLALHGVLARSAHDPPETTLASGRAAPLVVLGDLIETAPTSEFFRWPCAELTASGDRAQLNGLLCAAGMARFDEHAAQLASHIRAAPPSAGSWDGPDRVLWLAMAEALGYGRNRAALRRLAASLLVSPGNGEPDASEMASLPHTERTRAHGLLAWHARWRLAGPWRALEPALAINDVRRAIQALRTELRVAERGAVSPSRVAIVAVNVVLPFAAALATVRRDKALVRRARAMYTAWPSLTSNQIVREMARTLDLSRPPRGALAQQGLHHIWQHVCREKRCEICPCATRATG